MPFNTLRNFANRHHVDFDDNLGLIIANTKTSHISDWATTYAQGAPIYHVTDIKTARKIILNNEPLRSHASLHPGNQYGGAVENTIGRTAEFDVACGLDEFVFSSIGKLAINGTGPIVALTLHRDVLTNGVASFKDIAAMDALIECPSEQVNEDADQSAINKANAIILGQFVASLVPATDFAVPFAHYLDTSYVGVDEFLQTYSFVKGSIDLPTPGSPAYQELVAKINLGNQYLPDGVFDYFRHGHYYEGPQIMVPDRVENEHIQSIIFYEGEPSKQAIVGRAAKEVSERHGVYVDLVTCDEVNEHVIANFGESTEITLSTITMAKMAAMNVLFNRKAS